MTRKYTDSMCEDALEKISRLRQDLEAARQQRDTWMTKALLLQEAALATIKWAESGNNGGNPWCMKHVRMARDALEITK